MPDILDTPLTLQEDFRTYCKCMHALNDAERRGDARAAWEALDDLDLLTLHANPSPVRTRAACEVARSGFRSGGEAAR